MVDIIDLNQIENGVDFKEKLEKKWNELVDVPGVFRYKLNVESEKKIDGPLGFVVQVYPSTRLIVIFNYKIM